MENSIKRSIIDQGLQLETFLQAIVAYAAGNLGYVGYLFKDIQEAIENGHDTRLKLLLKLQIVPSEQERLCAFLLRQIKTEVDRQHMEMTDPETKETYPTPVWHAVYLHILGVLAVSREPLALSQIVKYGHIGVDQGYVKEALNRLSQFLICSENRYRLFHQSLAEFLTSDRTRERPETADLFVDPIAWHRRICSSILAKLGL